MALGGLLIPTFGLVGAVLAMTVAQGLALLMIYWFNWRHGYQINGGVLLATALPLALGLGEQLGGPAAIALSLVACFSPLLLTTEEKRTVLDAFAAGWTKIAQRRRTAEERCRRKPSCEKCSPRPFVWLTADS